MPAMRRSGGIVLVLFALFVVSCTRNVDDLAIYAPCFLDRECHSEETDGCFLLQGETANLGICSIFCDPGPCPSGGTCTSSYEPEDDSGTVPPICVQPCASNADCPTGGLTCSGGACLPP
jgi:hypothetical protein